MPKTKISEYSTTNSSNTDIEGINIDEGCPPSSINNAIRELMVHLKEFQTGASGDAFTFAGGTLMSGTNTISGAAVISGNINSSGTTNTFSGGNIFSGTNTFSGTNVFSSDVTLNAQKDLRFADSDSSNWVAFQAPATVSSNVTWTLPAADGTSNQVLATNGSGTLSWSTASSSQWTTSGSDIYYDTGNVAIGSTSALYSSIFTVANSYQTKNGPIFVDTRNQGVGTGAMLNLGGKYNTAGDYRPFASIRGAKTNATDGNSEGFLTFETNNNGADPTERARFNSTGAFVFAGGTTTANGIGITFPATASASTDANTLDDYEEGTWTPTLPNGGTLSVSSARYVKIGQQVMVSCLVSSVAPTNDGSQFRIGGLPFANGYASVYNGGCFGYTGDSNLSGWLPLTGDSSTYIFFHIATGAGARTNAQYLTAAAGASDEFIITITYFAAT